MRFCFLFLLLLWRPSRGFESVVNRLSFNAALFVSKLFKRLKTRIEILAAALNEISV